MTNIESIEELKHILAMVMALTGARFGTSWRHAVKGEKKKFYDAVDTVSLNDLADKMVSALSAD